MAHLLPTPNPLAQNACASSPYSWLAFETLMRYRRLGLWDNINITLRPFFLGGVMKVTG